MNLREAWERHTANWIRWARDPGVEDLRELYDYAHPRWHKVPLVLRFDARKPR